MSLQLLRNGVRNGVRNDVRNDVRCGVLLRELSAEFA
jgi:hypothetical protein